MRPAAAVLDLGSIAHEIWTMVRRDHAVLIAVGGLFVFVPLLAQAMFVTLPPAWPDAGAKPEAWEAWLDAVSAWGMRNDPMLVAFALVSIFGTMSLFRLYVDRDRPDVAATLRTGLALFPRFVLLALLVTLPVNLGMLALLVPGLYLKGRLFVAAPAFLAERPLGVSAAWRRSFALTRGHSLVLMALACVPLLAGYVLSAPFDAIGQSADGAPMANPVAAALIDLMGSAVRAVCAVAAILLELVVYRRLSNGT